MNRIEKDRQTAADNQTQTYPTFAEAKEIVMNLVSRADCDPKSTFGMIFLFDAFRRAAKAGGELNLSYIVNLSEELTQRLFEITHNAEIAEKAVLNALPAVYRAADFSSD